MLIVLPVKIFTEVILDTLTDQSNKVLDDLNIKESDFDSENLSQDDDGWFSGLFPSYKKTSHRLKINQRKKIKKIIKSNEPILVKKSSPKNKLKFWNKLFPSLKPKNSFENDPNQDIVQKTKTKEDFTNLQKKFIPPKIENRQMKLTDEDYNVLSQTQLSDTNNVVMVIPKKNNNLNLNYSDYEYLKKSTFPRKKKTFLAIL